MNVNYAAKAAIQKSRAEQHLKDLITSANSALEALECNGVRYVNEQLAIEANVRLTRWDDASETAIELGHEL